MEQFRMVGKVLGSLKALMVFSDDIQINRRQCSLLVEVFDLAFELISAEMKKNLKFDERNLKWRMLEQPMRDLHRVYRDAEAYVHHCLDVKDWFGQVMLLGNNADCVEFHVHNLLALIPVVIEAVEMVGEITGSDEGIMQKKKLITAKKYDKEWVDQTLFEWKLGKQYLASQDIRDRMKSVIKEDRWSLLETIDEKRESGDLSKHEQRLADALYKNFDELVPVEEKMFSSSIMVGWKDYHVRRRLGGGSQYKEISWLGDNFAIRHFFGEIDGMIPEITQLATLVHPNVSQFLCCFSDDEKKECFIVMELMNKDLGTLVKETCSPRKPVPFTLPVAVDIMLQIARGMEYLHSQKYYHGDLNPSNVLVKARQTTSTSEVYLQAKVSGFNLYAAKNFTPRHTTTQNGPKNFIWHAPEVLHEQEQPGNINILKHTEKADVYSFGMVCYHLLTGKIPFDDTQLQGDKMSRNIRSGERPVFPNWSPKYLVNLTKRCWQTDPNSRPSFSSICRILRYVKKFLLMNPDSNQLEMLSPLIDYCELEECLVKKFPSWENPDVTPVLRIPFEMFAYKVLEKEKIHQHLKEKGSESESDVSFGGDDMPAAYEDAFPVATQRRLTVISESNIKRISSPRLGDGRNSKPGTPTRGNVRPPNAFTRNMRVNSENHLMSPSRRINSESHLMSPSRRRTSDPPPEIATDWQHGDQKKVAPKSKSFNNRIVAASPARAFPASPSRNFAASPRSSPAHGRNFAASPRASPARGFAASPGRSFNNNNFAVVLKNTSDNKPKQWVHNFGTVAQNSVDSIKRAARTFSRLAKTSADISKQAAQNAAEDFSNQETPADNVSKRPARQTHLSVRTKDR